MSEITPITNSLFTAEVAKELVEAVFEKIVDPALERIDKSRKQLWGFNQ